MNAKQAARKGVNTLLFTSGFLTGPFTVGRAILMTGSVIFSIFIWPSFSSPVNSVTYFTWSTLLFAGLIFGVLSTNGLRLAWIKALGEEKAYRLFETLVAFAIFHNAVALLSVSRSTATTVIWEHIPPAFIHIVAGVLFVYALAIKIWSAWVLGMPLCYWKDMFTGRGIRPFVVKGPYQYLDNPMYGAGQLHIYAIALYYGSMHGLICALISQGLLYCFYYTQEYPFIKRVYISPVIFRL